MPIPFGPRSEDQRHRGGRYRRQRMRARDRAVAAQKRTVSAIGLPFCALRAQRHDGQRAPERRGLARGYGPEQTEVPNCLRGVRTPVCKVPRPREKIPGLRLATRMQLSTPSPASSGWHSACEFVP